MANFTPQEIEQFLEEFFDVVGTRQYTGARYIPIFGRKNESTVEWDNSAPYEPLTVVMHQGVSYVSRQYVPKDVDILDTNYWAETYRFNAQVEQYRQEVLSFQEQINALRTDLEDDYVPFPDGVTWPKYGTLGQVLTTLSNGETKWQDPIIPSDEQAEAVITEWLNEHPEATTTVQDGAITTLKLHDEAVTDAKQAYATKQYSNVVLFQNSNNSPIIFDTTNTTMTVKSGTFVFLPIFFIAAGRIQIATDITIDYSTVNTQIVSVWIDASGNITITTFSTNSYSNPNKILLFSFDKRYLNVNRCNNIPCEYECDGSKHNLENSLRFAPAYFNSDATVPVEFNTSQYTVTINSLFYLFTPWPRISSTRFTYSQPVTLNYANVATNFVYVVSDSSGNISLKSSGEKFTDDTLLVFYFHKNKLTTNRDNNIPCPYSVNGVMYNNFIRDDTTGTVYVATDGSDSNTGTEASPFATISHAISSGAKSICVSSGSYAETITITNSSGVRIFANGVIGTNSSNNLYTVKGVSISKSFDVHISDCCADKTGESTGYGFSINNDCHDIEINNCVASNCPQGGFLTNQSTNVVYNGCVAHDIGTSDYTNADGYNMHGSGVVFVNNCIGYDIIDDGVSNHDSCVIYVNGGEYYNCTYGGGIAPTGYYSETNGVYVHDCGRGFENAFNTNAIIQNSVFINNNVDIYVSAGNVKAINSVFDTESVDASATLTKIVCRTSS